LGDFIQLRSAEKAPDSRDSRVIRRGRIDFEQVSVNAHSPELQQIERLSVFADSLRAVEDWTVIFEPRKQAASGRKRTGNCQRNARY